MSVWGLSTGIILSGLLPVFIIAGGFAFILSGILAFALAAPAGVLIGRLLNRTRRSYFAANIEPE